MSTKIKKLILVASLLMGNNTYSMHNNLYSSNNIENLMEYTGNFLYNLFGSQQSSDNLNRIFNSNNTNNILNDRGFQSVANGFVNFAVNSIDKDDKNNIVNKILYKTEASKMLIYNKENNIEKSNEDKLTIFIPGKDQTIDELSKDDTLKTINELVPGDIMLLDYHKNRKNPKYNPDISKIDDFFKCFSEEIKREKLTDKINKKNEIIIIGYSLGCLYANLLVDYLKENFFKSKNNIRISLILLKPFVNIWDCVNTLLKGNTGFLKINDIGKDLIKKTSNDIILNNRFEKYKNNRVSFIDSEYPDHSLRFDEISQGLKEYLKITKKPYGYDKYNYKYDTTIILTSKEDKVVGNEIKNKIKHINNNNVYNNNIKNQIIDSNLKKNNQIINSNIKKNNIIINSNPKKNNQNINDQSILSKSILKAREMINYAIINNPHYSSFNKIAKENFVFNHIEGEAEEEEKTTGYTYWDKKYEIIDEALTKKQIKENKEDNKFPNKEDKKSPNKEDNKSPKKVKNNTLVIFVTGEMKPIDMQGDRIINKIREDINSDILLIDYHKSEGNKNYSPDIFNIEDFFKMFDKWLDENPEIKNIIENKKEIIIIGHLLGALYANRLVDHLRNGIFKDKTDILIPLILIKPLINLNECISYLDFKKTNENFDIKNFDTDVFRDDVIEKISNIKILEKRMKDGYYDFTLTKLFYEIKEGKSGRDLFDQEIKSCIDKYNEFKNKLKNTIFYQSQILYSPVIILKSEGVNDEFINKDYYGDKGNKFNKKINEIIRNKKIINNMSLNDILITKDTVNKALFTMNTKENFVFKPLLKKENKSNTIDDMGITNDILITHTTEVKNDTLVIFIPDENLTYKDKYIENLIINKNEIISDILLIDYNKSEKNKNYSPDIFKIEDFFKIFDEWLDKDSEIKNKIGNKKEIIIIGHSLGALYANKLVDHLRNGILKDKTDILIHLILIKPFSDINSCVNTLLKEVTQGINCIGINDELNKKTSNVEIIKKRLKSKNSKYSINGLIIDMDLDSNNNDLDNNYISSSIYKYKELKNSELKNNSKCCSNIILITLDNKDYVSGNNIIKPAREIK